MGLRWIGLGFVIVWFVVDVDFWLDVCIWWLVLFGCFGCGVLLIVCVEVCCFVGGWFGVWGWIFVGLFDSCGLVVCVCYLLVVFEWWLRVICYWCRFAVLDG